MSSQRILLAGRGARTEKWDDDVGLLFEVAPDSSVLSNRSKSAIPADAILGTRECGENTAASVLHKLVSTSPLVEGVNLLDALSEQIMDELVSTVQVLSLNRFLRGAAISYCEIRGEKVWFERLQALHQVSPIPYKITHYNENPTRAESTRTHYFGIYHTNWIRFSRLAARKYFPGPSAWMEARFAKADRFSPGGVWFFGAAYNTTSIGAAYLKVLPKQNHVYSEVTESGRKLRELGLTGTPIYNFANLSDFPRAREVRATGQEIQHNLRRLTLGAEDGLVRDLLVQSESFNHLLSRMLFWVIASIRAGKRMLQQTQPELLVVGNAAFERPLLTLARQSGIPTVMLQHGVIHSYYRLLDQPVDHFLARGSFFGECVNDALFRRTKVLNVPGPYLKDSGEGSGKDIVFVTSPVEIEPRWDFHEVPEILAALLQEADRLKCKLIIRVHPTENVETYISMVEKIKKDFSRITSPTFSQHGDLAPVLRDAAVAVLYNSTVFLNCLMMKIPIISFDWHNFPFKEKYKTEEVFTFASDIRHLRVLLRLGVEGRLKPNGCEINRFLAPTTDDEVRAFLESTAKRN